MSASAAAAFVATAAAALIGLGGLNYAVGTLPDLTPVTAVAAVLAAVHRRHRLPREHHLPSRPQPGSHGCVNLLPADAVTVWEALSMGATVHTFGRRPAK